MLLLSSDYVLPITLPQFIAKIMNHCSATNILSRDFLNYLEMLANNFIFRKITQTLICILWIIYMKFCGVSCMYNTNFCTTKNCLGSKKKYKKTGFGNKSSTFLTRIYRAFSGRPCEYAHTLARLLLCCKWGVKTGGVALADATFRTGAQLRVAVGVRVCLGAVRRCRVCLPARRHFPLFPGFSPMGNNASSSAESRKCRSLPNSPLVKRWAGKIIGNVITLECCLFSNPELYFPSHGLIYGSKSLNLLSLYLHNSHPRIPSFQLIRCIFHT